MDSLTFNGDFYKSHKSLFYLYWSGSCYNECSRYSPDNSSLALWNLTVDTGQKIQFLERKSMMKKTAQSDQHISQKRSFIGQETHSE